MTIYTGDYVVGVRTADGREAAMRVIRPSKDKYCVAARTADGHTVAVRLDPLNKKNQIGIRGRAADGQEVGLRSRCACPTLDLGLGDWRYAIFPTPYGLNNGYADIAPTAVTITDSAVEFGPNRDAFIDRWTEGIAGIPYTPQAHPLAPSSPPVLTFNDSIVGSRTLEQWVDQRPNSFLPFRADLPTRTLQGFRVIDLADWPEDGVNLHSQPYPIVFPTPIMSGPGYLHGSGLWIGAEESLSMPFEIATEGQTFVNLKAWLEHLEEDGLWLMKLHLRVWVAVVVGKQFDFQQVVPMTITNTAIECPDPGTLEGSMGWCGATIRDKGLASLGCFCQYKGPWGTHYFDPAEQLGVGWNNLCRTNCANPPPTDDVPSSDPMHKRFLSEVVVYGSNLNEDNEPYTISVPWDEDLSYTYENLREQFDIPAEQSIPAWVAASFDDVGPIDIATEEGAASLTGVITAKAEIAAVNGQAPPGLLGDLSISVNTPGECYPEIAKVQLTSIDGYIERLKRLHQQLLVRTYDAYHAGRNTNLLALVQSITPLGAVNTVAQAYFWVCCMWRSLNVTLDLLDGSPNGDGIFEASKYGPIPLATHCFPGNDGDPPGYDPVTEEWVWQVDGPTVSPCLTTIAYTTASDCQFVPYGGCPHPGAPFYTTDWGLFFEQACTALLPPTWQELNPGEFCYGPCWTKVGQGGLTYVCGVKELACENIERGPEPCEEPSSPNETCNGFLNPNGWKVSQRMPRLWIWKHPRVQVRIKFDGPHVLLRVRYEVDVLREETCWLTSSGVEVPWNPEEYGGPWPPSMTLMDTIEVGFGGQVTFPRGVQCNVCQDGGLPRWLYELSQSIGHRMCCCDQPDPTRIEVCGNGNRLAIYL